MGATEVRNKPAEYQKNEEEVKKEKYVIEITEKEEFIPTQETEVTTSLELCKKFNRIFKSAYSDYYGCTLTILPNGGLSVALFFDIPDGSIHNTESKLPYAFEPIDRVKGNGTMTARYNRVTSTAMNPNKKIVLTDEGKDGITKFLGLGHMRRDPMWDKRVRTITSGPAQYGRHMGKTVMVIDGIDPLEILKEIYGWKDDTTGQIWYQIQPIYPLSDRNAAMNNLQNWILNINRLFEAPLEIASEQVGLMPSGMNGAGLPPMVRA